MGQGHSDLRPSWKVWLLYLPWVTPVMETPDRSPGCRPLPNTPGPTGQAFSDLLSSIDGLGPPSFSTRATWLLLIHSHHTLRHSCFLSVMSNHSGDSVSHEPGWELVWWLCCEQRGAPSLHSMPCLILSPVGSPGACSCILPHDPMHSAAPT